MKAEDHTQKSGPASTPDEPDGQAIREWDGAMLRQLRYRIAWSQAEMARHLGCSLEKLATWERSTTMISQLDFVERERLNTLTREIESQTEHVALAPVAEALIKQFNLNQIHIDQIETNLAEQGPAILGFEK